MDGALRKERSPELPIPTCRNACADELAHAMTRCTQ